MQELKFKKREMIKINGKRFSVIPSLDEVKVEKVTKEEERLLCKELLDRAYAKEFKGLCFGDKADSSGDRYYEVVSLDNLAVAKKYYVKYLRLINNPSYYGLNEIEGVRYYLYCDHENDELELFKIDSNGALHVEEDFREKLLDGEIIK